MELLKNVYFYTQKSIAKAGNSKFQDLINVPPHYVNIPICFIPQVSPFYIVEKVK